MRSDFRILGNAWRIYRQVIPTGVPAEDIEKTRCAFYAGAAALLDFLVIYRGLNIIQVQDVRDELSDYVQGNEPERR